jgi:type I restriction enzyme R subunit
VPIYYELRLAKLDINQAVIETFNDDVDDILYEDDEDEEGIAERESIKSSGLR